MSINDVNRILHDYRHGSGSYNQQSNSMYYGFVNSTMSYGYSSNSTYSNASTNRSNYANHTPYNSSGYYYSSSIFS